MSKTRERSELSVFGYIREHESQHNINIPMVLKHKCFNRFYDDEHFDPNKLPKFINITDNNTKVKVPIKNHKEMTKEFVCAYGVQRITKDDSDLNFKWKFTWNTKEVIDIGITTNNGWENHWLITLVPHKKSVIYVDRKVKFKDRGDKNFVPRDDCKIIILELMEHELRISNQNKLIYSFGNIKRETLGEESWQMVVQFGKKSTIQLWEFEVTTSPHRKVCFYVHIFLFIISNPFLLYL